MTAQAVIESNHRSARRSFAARLREEGLTLSRREPRVLQVNTGKLCNIACAHCHVNAGPGRKEIMAPETMERILEWLKGAPIDLIDLTGGTPEMVSGFRHFVESARAMGKRVMDRCNLTILNEPGYEWVGSFHARHAVEIVASMPCYTPENVNAQRGEGVFDSSIAALQELNRLGYGRDPELVLNLVYNPVGADLPPPQAQLEADYKRELEAHFGIVFNQLYAIANMPIARFASYLKRRAQYESYLQLLIDSFNPAAAEGLMCRDTISVDWRGAVYDCDFNQQLGLGLGEGGAPLPLWDVDLATWQSRPIRTGPHCFGCAAGQGSSCGGSTVSE